MKILLTGHGRCGSTSLHYGLSDIMNHKMVLEPFNRELWKSYYKTNPPFQKGDEIGENVILVAGDDGAEEGGGGSVCSELACQYRTYHNPRF